MGMAARWCILMKREAGEPPYIYTATVTVLEMAILQEIPCK